MSELLEAPAPSEALMSAFAPHIPAAWGSHSRQVPRGESWSVSHMAERGDIIADAAQIVPRLDLMVKARPVLGWNLLEVHIVGASRGYTRILIWG